jgi:hypothetical protein
VHERKAISSTELIILLSVVFSVVHASTMATIAPPPTTSHQANPRPKTTASGTDQLIDERIEEARRSLWWAELIRSGLKLVITTIIAILVWLVVDQWIYSPNVAVRSVVFVGLLGLAGWYLKVRVLPLFSSTVRPEYAARALERNLPELRQSLTSYVTLRSESNKTALQTRVVRSMGSVTAGRLRTYDEIPEEAAGNFRWWIATALVFALLLGYAVASPKNALHSVARLVAPIAEIDPARRVKITEVLPGNVDFRFRNWDSRRRADHLPLGSSLGTSGIGTYIRLRL